MGRLTVALALLLLLAPALAHVEAQDARRVWSTVPPGPYARLPAVALNFTASDGTHISYGVHRPAVPDGVRVPVILTAGPYFALVEEPVTVPSSQRLSGFLIENFVSHGYAVVAASVRGTGWSGGCMELMSAREAKDLDELVTHLAHRPWADGNVAMIGKSYDGSTPWMVAQFGNPHLKTIVPIAGVSDMGDLNVHRGVPEYRAPLFHSVVYHSYGFGMEPIAFAASQGAAGWNDGRRTEDRAANAACPELARSQAFSAYSTLTGDIRTTPGVKDYWAERNFQPGTIENFHGSVFVVHGLQDWNVKPRMVVPLFNDLPQEKKMWLGQWGHHYPDEGRTTNREDFARVLKAWFDRHLKGLDVDTGPVVEVADARTLAWRTASEWPATDGAALAFGLRGDRTLAEGEGGSFRATVVTPLGIAPMPACPSRFTTPTWNVLSQTGSPLTFQSAPLARGFRLSGVGVLDVTLEPATAGYLTAVVCADERVVAHGSAGLLYADGTNDPTPYAPGLPHRVRVELEPAEHSVPAGARLSVALLMDSDSYTRDSHFYTVGSGVAVVTGGTLTLPVS